MPVREVSASAYTDKIKRLIERIIPGAEIEVRDNLVIVNVPRIAAKTLMKKMKRLKKLEDKYGITIRVNMIG